MTRTALYTLGLWAVLAALFSAATLLMLSPHGFTGLADLAAYGRPALMAAALLSGIYFQAVYDELRRSRKRQVSIADVLRRSFRSRQFWMALTVSPIVLLSFLPAVDAITSDVLLALVCFEHGFFFRSILARRERDHARDAKA